ncbi:Rv2578c family radical SAM protein [Nakamurella lactea]|uniref:Rv2578c family radical SAM protein n=1 Tax=Nakamurella lactea TaxID=459515 RepID=UPI0004003BFC|nr:Rv2578c family radical SAM protein [Nakamurella lactea]
MRWDAQRADRQDDEPTLPGMPLLAGLVRSVRPPEFAGVTFHEVLAKSALNKVPGSSAMPFGWTVNPYRGCTHACAYCFARNTHTYLELDAGHDFDSQIVVKTNVGQVLRRELARPGWQREHVALGTNTDPYQRAEGRYALMPRIIDALADSGTPFSILTKGTVLSRDLDRLARAATKVPVGIGISLALLDPELQANLEPGTPSPKARLNLIRRVRDAGLPCGVFVAPLLPHLTDSLEQITELCGELAAAGATGVSGIPLHLRPGTKEWFLQWLSGERAELLPVYERLYRRGAYLPRDYRDIVSDRIRTARRAAGLGGFGAAMQGRGGVPGDARASFPAGSLPTVAPPTEPDRAASAGEQLRLI